MEATRWLLGLNSFYLGKAQNGQRSTEDDIRNLHADTISSREVSELMASSKGPWRASFMVPKPVNCNPEVLDSWWDSAGIETVQCISWQHCRAQDLTST